MCILSESLGFFLNMTIKTRHIKHICHIHHKMNKKIVHFVEPLVPSGWTLDDSVHGFKADIDPLTPDLFFTWPYWSPMGVLNWSSKQRVPVAPQNGDIVTAKLKRKTTTGWQANLRSLFSFAREGDPTYSQI